MLAYRESLKTHPNPSLRVGLNEKKPATGAGLMVLRNRPPSSGRGRRRYFFFLSK
jgi:hypothetical protein